MLTEMRRVLKELKVETDKRSKLDKDTPAWQIQTSKIEALLDKYLAATGR